MISCELDPFKQNTTCAVTGHRILPSSFDEEILERDLSAIVSSGFDTFLVGMAWGFDMKCFRVLDSMRQTRKLEIVAVIPCLDQAAKFPVRFRDDYAAMTASADRKVVLYDSYRENCMLERNDFLVENSSLLYSFYSGSGSGGTYYTVRKAVRLGVEVRFYGFSVSP